MVAGLVAAALGSGRVLANGSHLLFDRAQPKDHLPRRFWYLRRASRLSLVLTSNDSQSASGCTAMVL